MNYLKKFESNSTNDFIHKKCREYSIFNYVINEDKSIDVNDDVDLSKQKLKKIPIKFNRVIGSFNCSTNELTTLENAPRYVNGNFYCYNNKLVTLEGGPEYVSAFFDCSINELTTLKHSPFYIGGSFDCYQNKLTNLKHSPYVSENYCCSNNRLTTLEGAPTSTFDFDCSINQLTTLEGAPNSTNTFECFENRLTTLKGIPETVNGYIDCSKNKQLTSLKYLSKNIGFEKVYFEETAVYEIFKLLGNDSLGMIRLVNDLKVIVDDILNIELLNDLLYDEGKSSVERVKGYHI